METIKISVDVCVNLSESTQNFIKSLLTCSTHAKSSAALAPGVPAAQAAAAPTSEPTKPSAAPAPAKPVASPAPGVPAAQAASSATKSIEDVRTMLASKVNAHRSEIKEKLNELGAPSVTKLDPSKYDDMYNFLESL